MPRATRLAAVALGLLALLPLQPRAAQQKVELVNGIGLIDYSQKPHFKVGDWVRYHVTGSSETGMHDDYEVTVLIGGEERFWGEDCFWVETWTEPASGGSRAVATLMLSGLMPTVTCREPLPAAPSFCAFASGSGRRNLGCTR